MKDDYDFSKGRRNPYAKMLKNQTTINIDKKIVDYFKEMASQLDIPYEKLINLYLLDCVNNKRTIKIEKK